MAWDGTCPPQAPIPAAGGAVAASETGCSRPRDIGTRRRCPTHSGERPTRHGHARLARRSILCRVVAGYHPPTRTYVYHQRATLKPSALGESGWASCVARASQICTKPPGRRLRHFGGGERISCSRVRCLEGGAPFWASRRGTRHPDIGSRPLGAVFIRIRGRSCIDHSSSRVPRHAHPRGALPATVRGALRPDQGRGRHARSSPTQTACGGEPGSRRPPGGRVAA